jgi:Rps23 Pro-64 3,4-dihydroxylase Tpa1-like proline 4-hydroxylase
VPAAQPFLQGFKIFPADLVYIYPANTNAMEPYLLYKDFLDPGTNMNLYDHTIKIADTFHQSRILDDKKPGKSEDLDHWRSSVFTNRKNFEDFYGLLSTQVRASFPNICTHLKLEPFDIQEVEMQLTSHNDGDFYKPHVDSSSDSMQSRAITFVYYFHSIPKMFTGGQLMFFVDMPVIVEPGNNSIVFFDSRLKHAVRPVSCPSKKFEHSRFTLNGWINR